MEYRTRWWWSVFIFFIALQIAGCGDSDADQRKAFTDFVHSLQQQQDRKLPELTEEQKEKFGPFVNDYTILTTFSQQFNQAVAGSLIPMMSEVSRIRVPRDYLSQRDALRQSIGAMQMLGQHIQTAKAQADDARRALKQPEELQVGYDRLYNRVVTQPVNIVLPLIPSAISFAQGLIQMGDYLQAQGDQVVFNGNLVQFYTPQQVAQYNGMVSALPAQHRNLLNGLKALGVAATP
ncbi:DUF3053 domain-containing protein [Brenneria rubrifaciens]|uniref:DUF3053 domain-containing protein n=2 Tax=Brenneria rubrifaciens TaxID=55213 RepID=A0A4P8QT49_9GAMM|nr:DUF3053 domain-containing protein [Brenneria rubrifaciens]